MTFIIELFHQLAPQAQIKYDVLIVLYYVYD